MVIPSPMFGGVVEEICLRQGKVEPKQGGLGTRRTPGWPRQSKRSHQRRPERQISPAQLARGGAKRQTSPAQMAGRRTAPPPCENLVPPYRQTKAEAATHDINVYYVIAISQQIWNYYLPQFPEYWQLL